MSTYLVRIIEVRSQETNNQWQTFTWKTDKRLNYLWKDPKYSSLENQEEKTREEEGIPLIIGDDLVHDHFTNNAVTFREILRDSKYAKRGFPKDSPNKDIPSKESYGYDFTYVTLDELDSLRSIYEEEVNKWYEKLIENKLNGKILRKLEDIERSLLALNKETISGPSDKPNDYEKDLEYIEESLDYAKEEWLSIEDEITRIYFIVDEALGVALYENIRILYYYE